ncbi:uncharacterized protein (DUF983 family) [Sphingomonas sp. BE138]|uniref:DUF983 domain-containing protein n=1 Tax=Sphingomonas sp. BE138 TaxID=2817845 RepID=UPI002860F32A|nr:DUF983 domain-containing protein [Sphingomonas sp. BE138]MDR6787609.1 uncharacterized protein (DUF983 family) [Sphingomonas sp. BE138]
MSDADDPRLTDASGHTWPRLSPLSTGARGRCPRCGKGALFRGFLSIRDRCAVCGLDYGYADPADGPAVFVQLFACLPGVIFTLMLEIVASPPWWVHLVVSLPVLLVSTVLPLRPIKGWLVASQFYFKAREGRLVRDE